MKRRSSTGGGQPIFHLPIFDVFDVVRSEERERET
jgi:hypothetical protein